MTQDIQKLLKLLQEQQSATYNNIAEIISDNCEARNLHPAPYDQCPKTAFPSL